MKHFIPLLLITSLHIIAMDTNNINTHRDEQSVDNASIPCAPASISPLQCRQNQYPIRPQCIYCSKRSKIQQRVLPRIAQRVMAQNSAS